MNESQRNQRLLAIRQANQAARRRALLALWLEQAERLHRTPARTPDERLAKVEALAAIASAFCVLPMRTFTRCD